MTKDEALKLALEALEQHGTPFLHHEDAYSNSLNALRQAIADAEKQESDDLTIAYMSGFHDGKNTPQPKPEQEPEAMRYDFDGYGWLYIDNGSGSNWKEKIKNAEPLYTTPPKRKWVGLTGPEVVEAYRSVSNKEWAIGGLDDARVFFCAIEAKLREKNSC